MANIIKIKTAASTETPAAGDLKKGELGYSFVNDKLWIGSGDGGTDDAIQISYEHDTHSGADIDVDTGALSGATIISNLDFNVTTDLEGHVIGNNGTVQTRELTLANLGYTGSTTANDYSLPTATGSVLGGVKSGSGITNTSGVLSVSTSYLASGHDASAVTSTKISNWDTAYTLIAGNNDNTINKINEVFAAFDSVTTDNGNFDVLESLNAKMDDGQTIDGGTF